VGREAGRGELDGLDTSANRPPRRRGELHRREGPSIRARTSDDSRRALTGARPRPSKRIGSEWLRPEGERGSEKAAGERPGDHVRRRLGLCVYPYKRQRDEKAQDGRFVEAPKGLVRSHDLAPAFGVRWLISNRRAATESAWARTIPEIAGWADLTPEEQKSVVLNVAERKESPGTSSG